MRYVSVPKELPLSGISLNNACFAPGRYVRFVPPNTKAQKIFAPLDKLIVLRETKIIPQKEKYYRYAEIGDIDVNTGGISFKKLKGYRIPTNRPSIAKKGDILVSTVRTYRKGIGCVADDGDNLVTTNAILNICNVSEIAPNITLLYIYSFLRSDFFTEQVWSMLNRGLYPRMDKGALDKILIPISSDNNVVNYISYLMQAIIDKEISIREKNDLIHNLIQDELVKNQKNKAFTYILPTISEISNTGRLDSAIHGYDFKSKIWLINNYSNGSHTPTEAGFTITPGPSLEIKILKTRIDSNNWRKGYYYLITPTNISTYGTIANEVFLGTDKNLPTLQYGDIIVGESGCHRSLVYLGVPYDSEVTTNAHGLYARRKDGNIDKAIFFRCIFDWLYKIGLIDHLSVGGSGGHFSPEYFDILHLPKFPEEKYKVISKLYHNDSPTPGDKITLDTFVKWHSQWNTKLGIWELDREMKTLHKILLKLQAKIIAGDKIEIPF